MTRASKLSVLNDHKRELVEVERAIESGVGCDNTFTVLYTRRADLQRVIKYLERIVRL